MNTSSNDSINPNPNPKPDRLREANVDYGLELPVEPGYRGSPPQGDWEAGYRLSLQALELVKDRPEIFEARERYRCDVEFIL